MELTRKQVIDNLSYIMDSMPDDACVEWRDSLAYAISSLKTDEAYRIMYEGVQSTVVTEDMTNGDVIKLMFRSYKCIEEEDRVDGLPYVIMYYDYFHYIKFRRSWWNSPYNALRGNDNE